MPRHLTRKQKKFICDLMDGGITDIAEIHYRHMVTITEMNDFETIYQAINNFIWDERMNGHCDETLKKRSTL